MNIHEGEKVKFWYDVDIGYICKECSGKIPDIFYFQHAYFWRNYGDYQQSTLTFVKIDVFQWHYFHRMLVTLTFGCWFILHFFLAFTCLSSMASINYFSIIIRDGRGRDHMVIGFTTAYAISHYHHWCCEFQSRSEWGVQHYVITFVSDMRQVSGFLQVLWFPSPIKLTATI
jgi:hypothetical protein